MGIQVVSKRPLEDETTTVSKRRRSHSPTSNSGSESTEEAHCSPYTPLTPLTPSTPISKEASRPKIHVCPYESCGKAFNRPVRLEEHLRSHTDSRPFRCPHDSCDKAFLRQSHLSHHIKSAHTTEREYVCNWDACDKKFATGTRLRRHQQAHEGRDKFRCIGFPPCTQTFRKHATLQRHIDVDHFELKAFPCKYVDEASGKLCESGFDTATKLRAHEGRCHGETRYWCAFCNTNVDGEEHSEPCGTIGFASYSELQAHIQLEHPPRCDHCSLVCSSSRELQRHVDIHHSGVSVEARRSFICLVPMCGKGFTKQGNLNIHIRTVHDKQKAFQCGVTDLSELPGLEHWDCTNGCKRTFGAKATLAAHIRTQHLGEVSCVLSDETKRKSTERTAQKKPPSVVARLTGNGYSEASGEDMECIVAACPSRFKSQHDLKVHAKTRHAMQDSEIEEALSERDALTGGRFWVGGVNTGDDFREDEERTGWQDVTGLDIPGVKGAVAQKYGLVPQLPRRDRDKQRNQLCDEHDFTELEALQWKALTDFCAPGIVGGGNDGDRIDPALFDEHVKID